MGRNLPDGDEILVKLKFGGVAGIGARDAFCLVKEGTAALMGLKRVDYVPRGKRNRPIHGAKGSKSYTLYLRRAENVGGANVITVDFPVPSWVTLEQAFQTFKTYGKLAGLRTPWGRSRLWAKKARRGGFRAPGGGQPLLPGGGGFNLPTLPSGPGDFNGIKDFVEDSARLLDQGYELYKTLDTFLPI